MRKLTIVLLAGVGLALAAPANADDVSVSIGDAGVRAHRDWRHHYARDYEHNSHCKTTIIRRHGEVKKIRRCW